MADDKQRDYYRVENKYFQSGRMKSSTVMKTQKDGVEVRDGICIEWMESGELFLIKEYKNGKTDGLNATFFRGNVLRSEFHSKSDDMDGRIAFFGSDGNCTSIGSMPDDPPEDLQQLLRMLRDHKK